MGIFSTLVCDAIFVTTDSIFPCSNTTECFSFRYFAFFDDIY